MSTDKRKPIPSPKHTLDDVLKALQDLVRNELADENADRGRPPRTGPRARDDFDDDAQTPSRTSMSPSPKPSLDTAAAQTTVAAQADTDVAFAAVDSPAPAANDAADADGDDATHAGGDADGADNATPAGLGDELSALFADDAMDAKAEITGSGEHSTTAPPKNIDGAHEDAIDAARNGAEQTSINWDDIPVLSEVVDLPVQTTPAAPNARTVAVRVVARLNIELRKAGTEPLDPAIIDRLEQLLREALDPSATASEQ